MEKIDLRSDTVTLPTAGMKQAMAEAELGDDVFGEDPTVNALQEEVARLLGKEAALFVPTGTMANQIALKAHTQPGNEVIIHPLAHVYRAEGGAGAALSSVQFRTIGNADGTFDPEEVAESIQITDNPHHAQTSLICMENTHNGAGGSIIPLENIQAVADVAAERKVPLHLDGARLLNAAVATDMKPDRITAPFQSTTLCFSKGLGAPVGSIIAGSEAFIHRCLFIRKMFGGGMRQAGVLAAAARYALTHHVERLAEDHANAKTLAEGLQANPHIKLPMGVTETNLVYFSCVHPRISLQQLLAGLAERGILIGGTEKKARAVTHLGVSAANIKDTVDAVNDLLRD